MLVRKAASRFRPGIFRVIQAWSGAAVMASTIAHRIAGKNGLSVSAVAMVSTPMTIAASTPLIGNGSARLLCVAFRAIFRPRSGDSQCRPLRP